MFLRATCKRNKLILLNSTWKMVKTWLWIPSRINRGDCLFTWKWKLTVDPLFVDCGSAPSPGSTEVIAFSRHSESWLLILSVNHRSAPANQDQQRRSPFHAKVKVDLILSLSSEAIIFSHKCGSRLDILFVNHRSTPKDQQRWSPFHAKVKVDCWSSLCRSRICPPWDLCSPRTGWPLVT